MAGIFDLDPIELENILTQSEFDELPSVGQPLQPPALDRKRFEDLNQEEIQAFIQKQENENTKRKTEGDMRLFKSYCLAKSEYREPEELLPCELDLLFGNFLVSVKKQNGSEYEPSTIRGFMSSLDRYLKMKNYQHQVNKGQLFPHSNNCIKAKLTNLKAQGMGNKPNESDELTDEDIDKLFEAGILGHDSPQQIVNLLHITFSLLFGMRGGKEQRDLTWGDIELLTDEDGDAYLQHIRERQTKTRGGNDPKNIRKFKPKAWGIPDDMKRCPVEAYKVYKQQRPKDMLHPEAPFFLSVNYRRNSSDHLWFKNQPVGKNHLYNLTKNMKKQCPSLNDGRKITNHSVRKHLVQKCNDMGLPANCTVQITGHKNLQSVNSYSKMNDEQQKKVANALIRKPPSTIQSPLAIQSESSEVAVAPKCHVSRLASPVLQSSQVLQQQQQHAVFFLEKRQ